MIFAEKQEKNKQINTMKNNINEEIIRNQGHDEINEIFLSFFLSSDRR